MQGPEQSTSQKSPLLSLRTNLFYSQDTKLRGFLWFIQGLTPQLVRSWAKVGAGLANPRAHPPGCPSFATSSVKTKACLLKPALKVRPGLTARWLNESSKCSNALNLFWLGKRWTPEFRKGSKGWRFCRVSFNEGRDYISFFFLLSPHKHSVWKAWALHKHFLNPWINRCRNRNPGREF